MNENVSSKLKYVGKYLLFFAIAVISLAGPTAIAQVKARPDPAQAPAKIIPVAKPFAFEVVSIRPSKRGLFGGVSPQRETFAIQPDGYVAVDQPLGSTLVIAYLPRTWDYTPESAPMNEPGWAEDEYDIRAKVAAADMAVWQKQGPQGEMLSAMLRSM